MADAAAREKVLETTDRIAADLTLEVLLAEGLDASLEGVANAALLGAAPHIFPLAITVPTAQAERARELVAAMSQPGEAAPDEPVPPGSDEAEPEDEDEEAPPTGLRKRSAVLAAGCTFVVPGGCHFYVRRTGTALTLVAGWVFAFVLLGASRHTEWFAAALMIPLLLVDLLGGLVALRGERLGRHPSRLRQVGAGLLLLAIAGAVPGVPAAVQAFETHRLSRELASLEVTCTLDGIAVANHAPTEREVELGEAGLRISYGTLFEDPTRQTLFLELPREKLRLAPGARVEVGFADSKRRQCSGAGILGGGGDLTLNLFAPTRLFCSRRFHLVSTRPGAPTLDAQFGCVMPTEARPQTPATASRR